MTGTTSPATDVEATPRVPASRGADTTLNGHTRLETHGRLAVEGQASPATKLAAISTAELSRGTSTTLNGQSRPDAQPRPAVEGQPSPATKPAATPLDGASRATQTADRQTRIDVHGARAVGADTPTRQSTFDAHSPRAGGAETGRDQGEFDTHSNGFSATSSAATKTPAITTGGSSLPQDEAGPQAKVESTPNEHALADPFLALAADVLDDLEKVRIANENRLRQLTRSELDSDGELRGFGYDETHPDVARLSALVDMLAKAEHQAELNLKRHLRKNHPLGPWVQQARGVGEKQAARLLASIGDPYWNYLHDRPRTVSELWAYCGYHVLPARQSFGDIQREVAGGDQLGSGSGHGRRDAQVCFAGTAATRARGQKANWSADAKMRAHLVAVSIVKAGGPYREVYDKARAKYEDATHAVECKRCGPSGRPAQPGTPLSAGHQHARALRIVAKEVLKDLWREAKRIHETTPATIGGSTSNCVASPGSNTQDT